VGNGEAWEEARFGGDWRWGLFRSKGLGLIH
jgi:hypothetical protein